MVKAKYALLLTSFMAISIIRAGGDGGAGRVFALPLFGGPYRKWRVL